MSIIKKTAWSFGLLLLTVCLLFSACATKEEAREPFPDVSKIDTGETTYKTHTVEVGDFIVSSETSLLEIYPQKAELSWDQSGARLQEVLVKRDQAVQKGDVLMTFVTEVSAADSAQLRLRRERSWETYLEGKNARLAAIEAAKENAKNLTGYDLQIANFEIEKLQAQYDQYVFQTTRSVYAIDDQIRALEGRAENNVLVAPFDGVIDSVEVINVGDPITPGAVLITMHSEDILLLQEWAPMDELRYNLPVTVTPLNNKRDIIGRVVFSKNILPASVISSPFINSLVKVDEPLSEVDLLAIDASADYQVLKNVLTVPKLAVKKDETTGKDYVYVLEGDILQKRFVTVNGFSSSGIVCVQEGLSAGETIVIE